MAANSEDLGPPMFASVVYVVKGYGRKHDMIPITKFKDFNPQNINDYEDKVYEVYESENNTEKTFGVKIGKLCHSENDQKRSRFQPARLDHSTFENLKKKDICSSSSNESSDTESSSSEKEILEQGILKNNEKEKEYSDVGDEDTDEEEKSTGEKKIKKVTDENDVSWRNSRKTKKRPRKNKATKKEKNAKLQQGTEADRQRQLSIVAKVKEQLTKNILSSTLKNSETGGNVENPVSTVCNTHEINQIEIIENEKNNNKLKIKQLTETNNCLAKKIQEKDKTIACLRQALSELHKQFSAILTQIGNAMDVFKSVTPSSEKIDRALLSPIVCRNDDIHTPKATVPHANSVSRNKTSAVKSIKDTKEDAGSSDFSPKTPASQKSNSPTSCSRGLFASSQKRRGTLLEQKRTKQQKITTQSSYEDLGCIPIEEEKRDLTAEPSSESADKNLKDPEVDNIPEPPNDMNDNFEDENVKGTSNNNTGDSQDTSQEGPEEKIPEETKEELPEIPVRVTEAPKESEKITKWLIGYAATQKKTKNKLILTEDTDYPDLKFKDIVLSKNNKNIYYFRHGKYCRTKLYLEALKLKSYFSFIRFLVKTFFTKEEINSFTMKEHKNVKTPNGVNCRKKPDNKSIEVITLCAAEYVQKHFSQKKWDEQVKSATREIGKALSKEQ